MSILQRLSRLVRADVHATLDRWEEPQAQLKQALREMEDILGQWEQQQQRLQQLLLHSAQQQRAWNEEVVQLNQQLQLSLEQDREDLARPLLRRRLWLEQQLKQLQQRRHSVEEQQTQLEQALQQGREEWQLLRVQIAQAESLETKPTWATDSATGNHAWVSDHEVELALLRERQRRAATPPAGGEA